MGDSQLLPEGPETGAPGGEGRLVGTQVHGRPGKAVLTRGAEELRAPKEGTTPRAPPPSPLEDCRVSPHPSSRGKDVASAQETCPRRPHACVRVFLHPGPRKVWF